MFITLISLFYFIKKNLSLISFYNIINRIFAEKNFKKVFSFLLRVSHLSQYKINYLFNDESVRYPALTNKICLYLQLF